MRAFSFIAAGISLTFIYVNKKSPTLLSMNRYIPAPASPAPLSQHNAIATWPGGVDPSAALFNTDNQRGGRRSRRAHRSRRTMHRRRSMHRNTRRNAGRR
jgi:hypothetical protein